MKKINVYWLVPCDERYNKSMEFIGCTKEYIDFMRDQFTKQRYVFIGCSDSNIISNISNGYGWMPFYDSFTSDYYESRDFTFLGAVNLDEDEIFMIKIGKEISKYNL